MPVVQTTIDLPARKSGRPRKAVDKIAMEEASSRSSRRSSGVVLEPPVTSPEKLLRTPRSRRKVQEQEASPGKRSAPAQISQNLEVSPAKQIRTPAKSGRSVKENLAAPGTPLTPSTHMARLSLASPRAPLAEARNNSTVKKGPLFSPQKISAEAIDSLLGSPVKAPSTPTKSPLKSAVSHIFKSPVRPVLKARTPVKPPQSPSIHPNKTRDFPSQSPKRMTVDALEDLLCSPIKSPIKQVVVHRSPRKPATPSKLSASPMKRSLFSPAKAKPAPALFKADVSQFQSARAALHTGTPSHLLCREVQVAAMSSWLDRHLVAASPGSIYVSGAPGTGKTATLVSLLHGKVAKYRSIFINCMVLKSAISIYREIANQLCPKSNPKTERAAMKVIEAEVTSSQDMVLLVLDEVDQLESKDQSVLYTVFEWPALQGSRLALVGIANSLDLTDRVLPRLQVKAAYKPTLLHYPPYTKQQLIDILTARLQEGSELGATPVITSRAIAYLASKISSLSGDLRKALDVCRRALELAEGLVMKQTLLKPLTPKGLASPLTSPRKGYKHPKMLPQVGQVDLPQIMKVVNQVYGSQVTASLGTKGAGLPVQQKILIASLLLMVKRGRTKEVTAGKLIDTYTKVLKKRNMKPELESACVGEPPCKIIILNPLFEIQFLPPYPNADPALPQACWRCWSPGV